VTWSRLSEGFIEHSDVARATPGAVAVQHVVDVDRTPDIAKVLTDTLVDAHSTIASTHYNDQFVPGALGSEVTRVTNRHFSHVVYTRRVQHDRIVTNDVGSCKDLGSSTLQQIGCLQDSLMY